MDRIKARRPDIGGGVVPKPVEHPQAAIRQSEPRDRGGGDPDPMSSPLGGGRVVEPGQVRTTQGNGQIGWWGPVRREWIPIEQAEGRIRVTTFGRDTHRKTRRGAAFGVDVLVYRFHTGLDLLAKPGSPVYPALGGTVAFVGEGTHKNRRAGYGNVVEVDHGNGLKTRYAHLGKTLVSEGQKVQRESQLAETGMTGNASGLPRDQAHLHFEVLQNGIPQDPVPYLSKPSAPLAKMNKGQRQLTKILLDIHNRERTILRNQQRVFTEALNAAGEGAPERLGEAPDHIRGNLTQMGQLVLENATHLGNIPKHPGQGGSFPIQANEGRVLGFAQQTQEHLRDLAGRIWPAGDPSHSMPRSFGDTMRKTEEIIGKTAGEYNRTRPLGDFPHSRGGQRRV